MRRVIARWATAAGLVSALLVGPGAPPAHADDVISDGGFEGATGSPLTSPSWVGADSEFGSPLCSDTACGNGAGAATPRSGSVFAWFGGSATSGHSSSLAQTLTLGPGVATLEFYYRNGLVNGARTSTLQIRVDGTTVRTLTDAAAAASDYSLTRVDLSAFADGGVHTLEFAYQHPAGGLVTMTVDDVALYVLPDSDDDGIADADDACPSAVGPQAGNGCPVVGASVQLKYRQGAFRGSAGPAVCRGGASVVVYRVKPGTDAKVGRATTTAAGSYRVTKPRRPGRYYAKLPARLLVGSAFCSAARSPTLTLR